MHRIPGDILFLGVGGKMGPTMARMARRATDLAGVSRRIIGVSRFSSTRFAREAEPRRDRDAFAATCWTKTPLPDCPNAPNVISMSGFKFGRSPIRR